MGRFVIPPALRQAVAERSRHRCCYCQSQEEAVSVPFSVDHIIPEALGGGATLLNLVLACWNCSLYRCNRIAAIDPQTAIMVRIFHPLEQKWREHFEWQEGGVVIGGLTPTGRATINALRLNRAVLIHVRQMWVKAGWHPEED